MGEMTSKESERAKMPTCVGVIGLGNMGSAMAANMIKAGFEVIGTDLLKDLKQKFTNVGGIAVDEVKEVGKKCKYIVLSLPSEEALNAVVAELETSCVEETIILETGTFTIHTKEKCRKQLSKHNITLLDTALSGTGAQAKNKDLVVLGSGDEKAFNRAIPIIEGFARAYYYIGEFGDGMKMKFIANQLVAIHNVAAAEAVLLGKHLGLDLAKVIEVIGNGAGSSRMFQVRGPLMADRTWDQPTVTNLVFQKDLKLIHEALVATGTPSPLFSATLPVYTAAMASGHALHDTASVYEVLERMSSDSGL